MAQFTALCPKQWSVGAYRNLFGSGAHLECDIDTHRRRCQNGNALADVFLEARQLDRQFVYTPGNWVSVKLPVSVLTVSYFAVV